MANPPPPYDNITGISRAVMKDNAQETIGDYNGVARPGELVVDLTTFELYVGNTNGNINPLAPGDRLSVTGSSVVLTKDIYNTSRLKFTGNATIETAGYLSSTGGLALVDSSSQQYVIAKSDRVQITTGFPDQGTGLGSYNEWWFQKNGVLKLPTTGIIENTGKQWTFGADGRTTFPTSTAPAHSYGVAGDKIGMLAFDSTYIYYCTADYVNNSTDIWKRVALDATAW